jgi:hypothetical protein
MIEDEWRYNWWWWWVMYNDVEVDVYQNVKNGV